MQIKITEVNKAKIEATLSAINGKAISHTASYEDIFILAVQMETKLNTMGIPQKSRAGAIAIGMSGGDVPSAYKWQRAVNTFRIERKSSEWFLTDITKNDVYGNAASDCLMLLPIQKEIAVAKFTAQFSVQRVVEIAAAA